MVVLSERETGKLTEKEKRFPFCCMPFVLLNSYFLNNSIIILNSYLFLKLSYIQTELQKKNPHNYFLLVNSSMDFNI